jgi:hypothetical protein
MLQTIKAEFGHYMRRFYDGLVPTTKALEEYTARGFERSCAWAPARMVDAVEDMLASWRRNLNAATDTPSSTAFLPVILVAMAKDYVPTGRDFGRQIPERVDLAFPSDAENRNFKVRLIRGDIRTQIAFIAADEPTAKSLAAQFDLFVDNIVNRRFDVPYTFEGLDTGRWPVVIESPEVLISSIATEAKNLTLLAGDLTLKASIPLFDKPAVNEPNDGAPAPSGYPTVTDIVTVGKHHEAK